MTVTFSPMAVILTVILLVVGYIALTRAVNQLSRDSYYSEGNELLINVVLAILYAVVCAVVGLLYAFSGFDMMVIIGMLALLVIVMLVAFLRTCIRNRHDLRPLPALLFVAYIGVVLYLTIFMRVGVINSETVRVLPFDDIQQAVLEGDMEMVKHMLANVILFLPFGYLIPAMDPKHLRHWSFALLGGLMTSTVIEGVQMVFHLGEADVDDLIANALGALVGYLVIRFVWQFEKNWEL